MIDAGLPLVQCLDILGKQEEEKGFASVIRETRLHVEARSSLADAMRRFPKVFDSLFTNMIAAGEAGGILDTILNRLATYIEKNVKLKSQVKSAMIYPIAVIGIAVVVAAILWKVIPTFASLFAGLGADLPVPTLVVIWLSDKFVTFMPVAIVAGIIGVALFKRYYSTFRGRRVVDGTLLKFPVLGMILREGGRGAILPNVVHAAQLWCANSRGARDHGQDGWKCGDRGCDHGHPRQHRAR